MKQQRKKERKTAWTVESAGERLGEILARVETEGPQFLTGDADRTVVMISLQEYQRLLTDQPGQDFLNFMESLPLYRLEMEREAEKERDLVL
jgi:hypothetical protein